MRTCTIISKWTTKHIPIWNRVDLDLHILDQFKNGHKQDFLKFSVCLAATGHPFPQLIDINNLQKKLGNKQLPVQRCIHHKKRKNIAQRYSNAYRYIPRQTRSHNLSTFIGINFLDRFANNLLSCRGFKPEKNEIVFPASSFLPQKNVEMVCL